GHPNPPTTNHQSPFQCARSPRRCPRDLPAPLIVIPEERAVPAADSRHHPSRSRSMKRLWPAAILALPLALACNSAKEKARADTAQALAAQQKVLMAKLEAQKDSLSQVVGDADSFIAKIDSQVSKVKGLPKSKKNRKSESPIQDQLQARKDMLKRVSALVERAQQTAK